MVVYINNKAKYTISDSVTSEWKIGDIVSPFLQNYYYIVSDINKNSINIIPHCDFAKKQWKCQERWPLL